MSKKNKIIAGALVAVVIVGGLGFWSGMIYAKGMAPARGNFAFAQGGAGGQFAGRAGSTGARSAGGITAGQVLSKDVNGITIKMMDGSTKIVLMGTSTQILKQASGTQADLTAGTEVTVQGSPNSDGSLTAQSVQIRPAGMGTPRVQ